MANVKISELPIGTPNSASTFPFVDEGTTYQGAISAITGNGGGVIETTYSELVDKITGETLTTGTYYIITDFKTCYDQPDFNSYGGEIIGGNYKQSEVEPIIVFATSTNTISTTAYQPKYPKDRIQYDWTFSATERTQGVAYGRISERVDEFNNRTDYDHRTVQFKRYQYFEIDFDSPYQGTVSVVAASDTEMNVNGTNTFFTQLSQGQYVGFMYDNDFRVYEISFISDDTLMVISGLTNTNTGSGVEMYPAYGQTNTSYLQNNITTAYTEYYTFDYNDFNVNNYVGNYANSYVYDENSFILANNVFQGSTYRNNTFGDMCYNNSFDDDCWNNTIGNYFYNNITDDDFDGNLIGNWFNNNRITSNFQYNRIGENFEYNYLVQNSFYRNNIMNGFEYNTISGDNFQNNEIGNQFANNVVRNGQFYKNDIGNGYNNNKVYSEFYGNLIGNGFNNNDLYCQFYDNTIGEYYNENAIGLILNPSSVQFYSNKIGNSFFSNDISGTTNSNVLGNRFQNNTIYNNFSDNKISNEFKGNMMLNSFESNNIDSFVGGNQFSGNTYENNIGSYTSDNDFLGFFANNNWKDDFNNNIIGNDFINNSIGTSFNSNTIGEGFGYGASAPQGNRIGSNFYNNNVGEYFYNNSIPDNFYKNEVGNYFQWNVINTNIDNTNFALNYGNITGFSYTALGTGATDNTYSGIQACGTTQSMGVGSFFDIEVSGGEVIGVSGATEGRLYNNNDVLTILGTQIGGITPDDDIVITVTGVTSGSLFYDHYTKQIFERRGGDKRVSFYDEEDILNVDSIYTISGYIPVYSQLLSFPIPYASFNFHCDGVFSNNGGTTSQTVNNTQELVTLFNNIFRQFGYFFDNNDGTIGVYINPSLKQQYCPSGTYTIYVFND